MIYALYESQEDIAAQLGPVAQGGSALLQAWDASGFAASPLRQAAGVLELLAGSGPHHVRPAFGLGQIQAEGRNVEVREEAVLSMPFGTLLHFVKDVAEPGPRVLVVAPLSGHFATRLRGTVAALLPEHDVYLTDWTDARNVPVSAGSFGLDDLVAYLIAFLEATGPGTHLLAVSQPAVAALAATALMAEDNSPERPRSLTLIAGPVDTRITPTRDNLLVTSLPVAWFEHNMIGIVPQRFPGAGRQVYPGALMLASSLAKDFQRQGGKYLAYLRHLAVGDVEAAAAFRGAYTEEQSVMDLTAELYLGMVRRVFQEHELALGRMMWRGRPVRLEAIRDVDFR